MFLVGLTIGTFVGATLAVFIMAACLIARRTDDEADHWPNHEMLHQSRSHFCNRMSAMTRVCS